MKWSVRYAHGRLNGNAFIPAMGSGSGETRVVLQPFHRAACNSQCGDDEIGKDSIQAVCLFGVTTRPSEDVSFPITIGVLPP